MNDVTKRFIECYKFLEKEKYFSNKKEFAQKINVSTSLLTEIEKERSEIGVTAIQNTVINFNINPNWLFTGNGLMINDHEPMVNEKIEAYKTNSILIDNGNKRIPLVYQGAVAGFGSSTFAIAEQDVKDYYVVPKFKHYNIDFMIEISGNSMYPKYNSGDIVACTIIHEITFIQWNKCHIIATREQGILIKRIKKGENIDNVLLISDNKDYDPFLINLNDICGLAIVVGVIRLV